MCIWIFYKSVLFLAIIITGNKYWLTQITLKFNSKLVKSNLNNLLQNPQTKYLLSGFYFIQILQIIKTKLISPSLTFKLKTFTIFHWVKLNFEHRLVVLCSPASGLKFYVQLELHCCLSFSSDSLLPQPVRKSIGASKRFWSCWNYVKTLKLFWYFWTSYIQHVHKYDCINASNYY